MFKSRNLKKILKSLELIVEFFRKAIFIEIDIK